MTPHAGSLKDRHIRTGDVIYAIFTPKENLKQAPQIPKRETGETYGDSVVRCHIMLKVFLHYCSATAKNATSNWYGFDCTSWILVICLKRYTWKDYPSIIILRSKRLNLVMSSLFWSEWRYGYPRKKFFLNVFFIFFVQGDFEVTVNLACDTITSLRLKLANESGIPAHVLYYK